MADSLKAQIEISADASGVDAGISKAKRSLADLGATATVAGRQAAEGIGTMGRASEEAVMSMLRQWGGVTVRARRAQCFLNCEADAEKLVILRALLLDLLIHHLEGNKVPEVIKQPLLGKQPLD